MGRRLSLLAAIDVGGTKTIIELFNAGSNTTRSEVEFPTPQRDDVVSELTEAIDDLRDGRMLAAIAVGCPGPLDPRTGILFDPPNLSQRWWHLPLGRELVERFHCDVVLENDGNLGALGEAVSGAGRGYPSVLYITVSTGVGAGFVVEKEIFRGGRGFGLEAGHTTIDAVGSVRCACGRNGCIEALASGSAIASRASAIGFQDGDTPVTARAVAAAASSGNALARQVLEEAAGHLAQGIVNMMYVLDPSVVLIGGGVAQSDLFIDQVQLAIESEEIMNPFRDVQIRRAELGRSSVITGTRVLAERADSRATPSV